MSREYVLIIGAMKCGTTTLFDTLAHHPAICASFTKEPEFFSERQGHKVHVRRYEDLWPDYDSDQHRYCLEGSTGYTKFPSEMGVPERIKAYGLQPRFIYIVREPIERIESQMAHRRINGSDLTVGRTRHMIALSSYGMQLERFRRVFGTKPFVVDFRALVDETTDALKQIFFQLDLPSLSALRIPHSRQTNTRLQPTDYRLSQTQKELIRSALKSDMRLFKDVYGFPVERWGF